jgi:peptidoglycan hydrolase CwlO-like protein
MNRQMLTAVIVAVVLSTAIGFTLGWAASPESANASTAATPQQETVRQLKKVNAHLGALNVKLAALNTKTGDTQTQEGSVRALLTIICDYTAPINCKPR